VRGRVDRAIARENLPGGLTCRSVNKKAYIILKKIVIFHPFADKPPINEFARNLAEDYLANVITLFIFCVDRLRGLGSVRGRILPFSIDLASCH